MKVILIVIDGFGLGAFPNAKNRSVEIFNKIMRKAKLPTLSKLGLNKLINPKTRIQPVASYGNLNSESACTDILTLYFELAGLQIKQPYPVYPMGLPDKILSQMEKELGVNFLGNIVVEGHRIINDLGALHYNTKHPVIYTSSSSVIYIAAHEEIIPLEELYALTRRVRNYMKGKYNVARVLACPFNGSINSFNFTDNVKCYAIVPPAPTMLDVMQVKGIDVTAIGRISQLFNGMGISKAINTRSNDMIFEEAIATLKNDKSGFLFMNVEAADVNREDDIEAYKNCTEDIDINLNKLMESMNKEDILIVTSSHTYEPPEHIRSYSNAHSIATKYTLPIFIYGDRIKQGVNFGNSDGLYTVAHTILDCFGIKGMDKSLLSQVIIEDLP